MWKMTQEVGSQIHKGQTQMWTVRTLVCSDWRLDVKSIAEELIVVICWEETTRTLAWQVDSPPWQCSYTWCVPG
jgi:hypothetical protein